MWPVEAVLIEALFILVFVRALGGYVARRDPLQRDVMLVFSAVAVLKARTTTNRPIRGEDSIQIVPQ